MTDDFEHLVRERAYQLWEQEGRCDGRAVEHWHAARRELAALSEMRRAATPVPAVEPAGPAPTAKRTRRRTDAPAAIPAETIAPAKPRRRRSPGPTLQ